MSQASSITLPAKANLLEAILYLASLASNQRQIDIILDPLREITARQEFKKDSPTPDDNAKLRPIFDEVVGYLTTREKVRAFTPEDLELRLQDRFEGSGAHHTLGITLAITFLITVVLGAGCLLIKPPASALENASDLTSFYILLSLPTMFTVVSLSAAWFFFSALRYFREKLQRAYKVIAFSVAALGIAHLQMPILAYVSTLGSAWVWDGGVGLLYVPTHTLIYVGTAIFARSIQIRNRFTAWPTVVSIGAICFVLVGLAPHSPARWNESFFDLATGTFPLGVVASLAAAINCYLIARRVNDIYRRPMLWLGHANMMLALTVAQILFVRLVFGYDNFWTAYGLIILPYFISSAFFLKAGYSFNKVSNY